MLDNIKSGIARVIPGMRPVPSRGRRVVNKTVAVAPVLAGAVSGGVVIMSGLERNYTKAAGVSTGVGAALAVASKFGNTGRTGRLIATSFGATVVTGLIGVWMNNKKNSPEWDMKIENLTSGLSSEDKDVIKAQDTAAAAEQKVKAAEEVMEDAAQRVAKKTKNII